MPRNSDRVIKKIIYIGYLKWHIGILNLFWCWYSRARCSCGTLFDLPLCAEPVIFYQSLQPLATPTSVAKYHWLDTCLRFSQHRSCIHCSKIVPLIMSSLETSASENLDQVMKQRSFIVESLHQIEQRSSSKMRHIAMGVIGLSFTWIATGIIESLACNAIGFLYPAYQTVKAIDSGKPSEASKWLMYWIVFAAFNIVEIFSDTLLSWFLIYFEAKCIFLLWCMAPISNNGSKVIYQNLIRPFILGKAADMSRALAEEQSKNNTASVAGDVVEEAMKKAMWG